MRKRFRLTHFLGRRLFFIATLSLFIFSVLSVAVSAQQRIFDDLLGVSFANSKEGWACGRWGVILHTTDGGVTWVRQNTGIDYTLTSISFVDTKNGWAVGDEGTIIRTEDGGKSWAKQKSPVSFYLMKVHFVTALNGWIVTEQTHILHTDDGGKTWMVQFKDQDYILKAISFSDSENGWAVGEYGFIYHTWDGGRTWKQQAGSYRISEKDDQIEGGYFLFDVTAVNIQTAWIVGIDGYVAKTVDRGSTWQRVNIGVPMAPLFCVATDKNRTVVIGGKGVSVVSTDGGKTWQASKFEPPITYSWIYGLAHRGSSSFIAVGQEGSIYRTENKNPPTFWKGVTKR